MRDPRPSKRFSGEVGQRPFHAACSRLQYRYRDEHEYAGPSCGLKGKERALIFSLPRSPSNDIIARPCAAQRVPPSPAPARRWTAAGFQSSRPARPLRLDGLVGVGLVLTASPGPDHRQPRNRAEQSAARPLALTGTGDDALALGPACLASALGPVPDRIGRERRSPFPGQIRTTRLGRRRSCVRDSPGSRRPSESVRARYASVQSPDQPAPARFFKVKGGTLESGQEPRRFLRRSDPESKCQPGGPEPYL